MNTEIFIEYIKYQNPSYLIKDLYFSRGTRKEKIVNHVNNAFIDLRNAVHRKKKFPKMKLPNKVMDIVEEIHKKQQKENDFI